MAEETTASPLAAYAGTWAVQVFTKTGTEPIVNVRIKGTDSKEGWAMMFDHLADPVPGHHVTVQADSVSFTVGPYSSALRENVMVTTTSVVHAHGDELSGRFTAVYTNSDPPVLQGRLVGKRTQ